MISSCVADDFDVGVSLFEGGELVLFASPGCDEGAAAALDGADHSVDVVVAHAADGELDGVLRFGVGVLRGFGDFMEDTAFGEGCARHGGEHSRGTHCFEKGAPIDGIIVH